MVQEVEDKYIKQITMWVGICANQRGLGKRSGSISGRVLDSRPRGGGFKPHWRHCLWSLSKTHLSLSKTHLSLLSTGSIQEDPSLTERLLIGRKESNQTNKQRGLIFSVCLEQRVGGCFITKNLGTVQKHLSGKGLTLFLDPEKRSVNLKNPKNKNL